MNAKEFEKYKGKKTKDGGIVVGYDNRVGYYLPLLIKTNGGMKYPGSSENVIFYNEKDEEDFESGKYTYFWCSVDNVIVDEPLDLTKILEGCEGVTLWSDIWGECKLHMIDTTEPHDIVVKTRGRYESFTKSGLYDDRYKSGKCLLFPSETNRDWSTFKKPVMVKDDDWVVCCDNNKSGVVVQHRDVIMRWEYEIPFDKFRPNMTDEELKKLSVI